MCYINGTYCRIHQLEHMVQSLSSWFDPWCFDPRSCQGGLYPWGQVAACWKFIKWFHMCIYRLADHFSVFNKVLTHGLGQSRAIYNVLVWTASVFPQGCFKRIYCCCLIYLVVSRDFICIVWSVLPLDQLYLFNLIIFFLHLYHHLGISFLHCDLYLTILDNDLYLTISCFYYNFGNVVRLE